MQKATNISCSRRNKNGLALVQTRMIHEPGRRKKAGSSAYTNPQSTVQEAHYLVQGMKPVAQLSGLSSENGVLSLDSEIKLGCLVQAAEKLGLIFSELSC